MRSTISARNYSVLAVGKADELRDEFFRPIGIFGIRVTAGLLAYELFCIRKCHRLLRAGEDLESTFDLPLGAGPTPAGQFFRRPGSSPWLRDARSVSAEVSLAIPAHTQFQVRNDSSAPLEAIAVTIPKWPGDTGTGIVDGRWPPTS